MNVTHAASAAGTSSLPRARRPWTVLVVLAIAFVPAATVRADLPAERLERLAAEAEAAGGSFHAVSPAAVDSAASGLRQALEPLRALLARSKSGADWKTYLEWPTLEAQAAGGAAADAAVLRRLEEKLGATETGLDMPEFVRVRRAVSRYAEAAEAARDAGAARLSQRLGTLASTLRSAAAGGSAETLGSVPQLLERLVESGQAPGVVHGVRESLNRPNILLAVHERLLATAVDRPVDQAMPIDELVLGTRIRGMGHTSGMVRVDFVPAHERAVFDLVLSARNVSDTRGTQGPVTVCSRGVTDLGARRRIFLTEDSVTASPVRASASTDTHVTGLGISRKLGRNLIRKVANRKIAEAKPRAEAIAEGRARDRLQQQFDEQTTPALDQFREQFQSRIRGPLEARGLYPEMFHMNTSDSELMITARKAQAGQVAAASMPPAPATGNLISARIHETAVNNVLEQKFGGRRLTQADVEKMARELKAKVPDSLENESDQQPWEVTFAKTRPITISAADGRVKLMVRGDKFVSGEREFPGMDIWATYAIGRTDRGYMLLREGDVQIYPPGFKPGGGDKLSPAETSLRRILQRRFDKLMKPELEIQDLPLEGELAAAGPLPMNQFESRRDGWIAAGWRAKDRVIHTSAPVYEEVISAASAAPVVLTSFTTP
jgi:hypothetical protein